MLKIALYAVIVLIASQNYSHAFTDAREYVVSVAGDLFKTVSDKKIPLATQKKVLVNRLVSEIDFEWCGRAVTGSFWKEMTDAQRSSFIENYKAFLVRTWMPKFHGYSGETYKIFEASESGQSDALVPILLTLKNGNSINIELRVRQKDGVYKILDLSVEGVSIARTYNIQFTEYMSKHGIEECINYLKTGKIKQ